MCKGSCGPGLEQGLHHICCVLLVKAQMQEVGKKLQIVMGGAINHIAGSMETPKALTGPSVQSAYHTPQAENA